MQIAEKSKEEIEARANRMQDFLKMEYLEECSKKSTSIEVLRYCFFELSKLYEKHSMYSDAVKYIVKLRQLNVGNKERIRAYLRETELLIKGGFYDRADFLFKELVKTAGAVEREEIQRRVTEVYKEEAEKFEKSKRYHILVKVYEKLVPLVKEDEKIIIQKRMVGLLTKLGKVRESIELEKGLPGADVLV